MLNIIILSDIHSTRLTWFSELAFGLIIVKLIIIIIIIIIIIQ
jgi:hypothetical protein